MKKRLTVAQECAKRIRKYLAIHPIATWKEIHENVPNHYKTSASLQFSMNKYFGISCLLDKGKGKTGYVRHKPCGMAFVAKLLGPDYLK